MLFFSACTPSRIPDAIIPKTENEFALTYLQHLCSGDTQYCLHQVVYKNIDDSGRAFIITVANFLKDQPVKSSRLINVNQKISIAGTPFHYSELEYEYALDFSYAYFYFSLSEDKGHITIDGFHADRTIRPLSETFAFTFQGRGLLHYVFLVFALAFVLFKIVSLVVAIKTRLPRKALWILFIIISISTFSLNWTSGDLGFRLLNFDLIGAGISRSGLVAPWIISVSLPIGAICFWIKRRNIKRLEQMDNEISATYESYQPKENEQLPSGDENIH